MRRFVSSRSLALTTLLVAMMLFAQSLGLLHSIVHAGFPVPAAEARQYAALFDYNDSDADDDKASASNSSHHHSCVEYDAATLADGVQVMLPSLPVIPGKHILALWQAFASWDAPFVCHFSSRAPPR
ncbi:hypothetical protein [Herbaspirillum autotrophicum]|uniref:hypothetical protein n=1 Tax=Herbaspirillum autotrophicum TaxID=180195 RepID=UPI00067D6B48|nr:hypothetical protein [Herbaspirillum autotrophicum]